MFSAINYRLSIFAMIRAMMLDVRACSGGE